MKHEELRELYNNPISSSEEKVNASIKAFQHYMNTYNYGTCCQGNKEIFIEDVLYMLGVALDPSEHRFANGFNSFKQKLINYLVENKEFEAPFGK